MKKIIAILALVASISLFSSCTDEHVDPAPSGGGSPSEPGQPF